jgi:hypothetical protein
MGGLSPKVKWGKVKRLASKADHSPLSIAESKNAWNCNSTQGVMIKHKDNFTSKINCRGARIAQWYSAVLRAL